jgi:hypothetical protein
MTDPYAVTSWGVVNAPFEMTTPSGQKCLVRKLTMEDVLAHGLINELDGIGTALIDETVPEDSEAAGASLLVAFKDTEKFTRLERTINKITQITVMQPVIYGVPDEVINPQTRKPEPGSRVTGRAYVDQISFMDKMSIFGKVFEGFKGLEQFREDEQASDLGTVENVEAVSSTAELPVGDPA